MIRRIGKFLNSSKKSSVRILHTEGNNIHFNIALEEYMFETENVQKPTLFLWRNSPTIVIGKHQNPWKECRVEAMKDNGVLLARRKTGGGAVYHDLGNTCFSFLTPFTKDQKIDYRDLNNRIIINSLKNLGVDAEVSGRNDLICDGRKFSGSAYRLSLGNKHGQGKKALHHGTIMFSVDFSALHQYLNPNKKKLISKGVDSVISRVINLGEKYPHVSHGSFCQEMQKQFIRQYEATGIERQTLDVDKVSAAGVVNKNYERLKSWEWIYGQCPYFSYTIQQKFQWGLVEVTFEVDGGKIQKCKIYSDCLYPDFISQIQERLIGVRYDKEGISELKSLLGEKFGDDGNLKKMVTDFCEWVIRQI